MHSNNGDDASLRLFFRALIVVSFIIVFSLSHFFFSYQHVHIMKATNNMGCDMLEDALVIKCGASKVTTCFFHCFENIEFYLLHNMLQVA